MAFAKNRQVKDIKLKESGFSLIETTIAMVILLVGLLGAASVFTYSVIYNTGNNNRSQALALLKQEEELIRSAKFTPALTDTTLMGGAKASKIVTAADGSAFKVDITVDDDPYTDGIQVNNAKTLKEITVTVTPQKMTSGWQIVVPAVIVIRRVRSN